MAVNIEYERYWRSIVAGLAIFFFLFSPCHVFAERAFDEVTLQEFRELGYKDEKSFIELYTVCVQVYQRLKNEACDNICIKQHSDWRNNNCDLHSESLVFLLMSPPGKPASSLPKKHIDGLMWIHYAGHTN